MSYGFRIARTIRTPSLRWADFHPFVDSMDSTKFCVRLPGKAAVVVYWDEKRNWSGRRGSNPQPPAWEADALPLSYSRSASRVYRFGAGSASLDEESVQFRQHFKRIGYIKHVCFSSRPSAVWVEIHRTALVDESPAHDMGLLAMATRGQTLGMARRRSGLADLVQMGHETEHRLTLSRLID